MGRECEGVARSPEAHRFAGKATIKVDTRFEFSIGGSQRNALMEKGRRMAFGLDVQCIEASFILCSF